MANIKDNMTAEERKKAQVSIDIFALFGSLLAFIAIFEFATVFAGTTLNFRYPTSMDSVKTFGGTIFTILILTVTYGLASQAGYIIIKRVKANIFIFKIYSWITIAFMAIEGLSVYVYSNWISFVVPSILIIAATIFSLTHIGQTKAQVYANSWGGRREKRKQEKEKTDKTYLGR